MASKKIPREIALRAERKYEAKNREKRRAANRVWAKANPDKTYTVERRQQTREWQKKNPHKFRQYKFGLTEDAFEAIMQTQNFKCAACKCNLWELKSKNVHVDHCHATKRVRGILCHGCNTSLGLMKEDAEKIKGLISYIEGFK